MRVEAERAEVVAEAEVVLPEEVVDAAVLEERGTLRGRERGDPFRGGEEGQIRRNLVENDKIDAIIGLPANIFFGTGIPTIIMVLKKQRVRDDILIIDASKGFVKEGKNEEGSVFRHQAV